MTTNSQPPQLPPAPPCAIEYRTAYPTPDPAQLPSPANFGTQAAKASWIAPIMAVGFNIICGGGQMNTRQEKLIVGLTSFAFYIFGLICGIIALSKIRRYGSRGILTPAIVGVAINGFFVAIFVLAIVAGFAMRK